MPTSATCRRMIYSTELIRTSRRGIVTSLHLHCHPHRWAAILAHLQSLTPPVLFLMAPSIHPCIHRPSYLSSNPSIPHDPSSTSSSFVETLLLIRMTKEREKSCPEYLCICSPRATVISLFAAFRVIDGRRTLKQTDCFDGLLSIRLKCRL